MSKLKILFITLGILAMTACTSTRTLVQADNAAPTQYNYQIVDEGSQQNPELNAINTYFERVLDNQLRRHINQDQPVDTEIKYKIIYNKGNRALRYFVGFGAGKARADIKVKVISTKAGEKGKVLATFTTQATLSIGAFGGNPKNVVKNAARDIAAKIVLADIFH
ncbi:DUF4410 domain-containing protein [Neisseria sp. ZJ106]|uniref:DUF4410 domain-containing protein n=1 Tax=Neisseria lisongii TaxID=2912188 RepID=A0ABY7RLN4_9NEIS|nr:DUF4410 domain-containing protein [Neisseria lisongii]MCF7520711.1 DUF4410 domain-containing protein [Neisseria lisongii]WCL72357.1 DUF4410 domain-containing protein [Neisseria lisongii]